LLDAVDAAQVVVQALKQRPRRVREAGFIRDDDVRRHDDLARGYGWESVEADGTLNRLGHPVQGGVGEEQVVGQGVPGRSR